MGTGVESSTGWVRSVSHSYEAKACLTGTLLNQIRIWRPSRLKHRCGGLPRPAPADARPVPLCKLEYTYGNERSSRHHVRKCCDALETKCALLDRQGTHIACQNIMHGTNKGKIDTQQKRKAACGDRAGLLHCPFSLTRFSPCNLRIVVSTVPLGRCPVLADPAHVQPRWSDRRLLQSFPTHKVHTCGMLSSAQVRFPREPARMDGAARTN
eukprot:359155-Chlamydomonas_euryale.AAC.3